jgi:hypothetical protein
MPIKWGSLYTVIGILGPDRTTALPVRDSTDSPWATRRSSCPEYSRSSRWLLQRLTAAAGARWHAAARCPQADARPPGDQQAG